MLSHKQVADDQKELVPSNLKMAVIADIAIAITEITKVTKEVAEKIASTLIKSQEDTWDVPSVRAMLIDLMETEGVITANENSEDPDVKEFINFWKDKRKEV